MNVGSPPPASAQRIIDALKLQPLAGEGGFFRPTWRSATGSAIYFLMTPHDFSALHRLAQDELWHFYAGDRVEHVQLDPGNRAMRSTLLGSDVLAGECPQALVPAGVWQGARLASAKAGSRGFALLGCTVSPPWDERDFTLGARDELTRLFPEHEALIRALTR